MTEPSTTVRTLHNLGLAAWFGGNLFGQVALNPTVSSISDKSERGRVLNEAWLRFNTVNGLAMVAAVGAWRLGGLKQAESELGAGAEGLVRLKNLFLGGAVVNSVASAALGARFASESPDGYTPAESGTEPAPETPEGAARAQRLIGFFGNGALFMLAGAAAVSAALEARGQRRGRGLSRLLG